MIYEDPRTARAREQYLGKEYSFNNGNKNIKMKVVKFDSYDQVTVQVGDTDIYITASMGKIKKGIVRNPFKENSPIGFTEPKYEYLNCLFPTNQGYLIRVLNCEDRQNVLYEFVDNGYQNTTHLHNILRGTVRNPYHPNKVGGYLGTDKEYRHKKYRWLYTIWHTMLIKGVDKNKDYYAKYHTGIDQSWYCYSTFARWYMDQYNQLNPKFDYDIDKDLKFHQYSMFTGGKKYYGPFTCVLIPHDLNAMLRGDDVSRCLDTGEKLPSDHPLKKLVQSYRDQNGLLDEPYHILMNIFQA